jgi:hypothetical protein
VTPRPAPAAALLRLAAVGLLAAGCTGPAAHPPDAGGPRLAGAIQQYREDEVRGVFQLALANGGPSPVVVERVEVAWAGFADPPSAAPGYTLGPGLTADLPLPVAPADCTASDSPQERAPAAPAVARVQVAGGRVVEVTLPASAALERLFTASCRRQFIESQVGVSFGPDWVRTGDGAQAALSGELEVGRREATGAIGLAEVDGSVLLGLALAAPPGPAGLLLPAGQAAARLPVEVRSTLRCDGHSLGESKQTFVFTAVLDLGDGQDRPYALTPDPAGRALMQRLLEDACGG